MKESDTRLLSLRELARRTGVSLHEVRRWRDEGGLRVYRTGRRRQCVIWSEFEKWLNERVADVILTKQLQNDPTFLMRS